VCYGEDEIEGDPDDFGAARGARGEPLGGVIIAPAYPPRGAAPSPLGIAERLAVPDPALLAGGGDVPERECAKAGEAAGGGEGGCGSGGRWLERASCTDDLPGLARAPQTRA